MRAKAGKNAAGGAPAGGQNIVSEVNEILQKTFRGQFSGQFMQWTFKNVPRGFYASVAVAPLEKSFDGQGSNKKEAQAQALYKVKAYVEQTYRIPSKKY